LCANHFVPFIGFLRDAQGVITESNVPGATNTLANSINDGGDIVGATYPVHAYIRNADGTFTTLDPAGAASAVAVDINASGDITGY
jgi:hypothetical protein